MHLLPNFLGAIAFLYSCNLPRYIWYNQDASSLLIGLIYLLPKGVDWQEIFQWQLITLLPIAYKALAKMISARVELLLLEIIHDTQTIFVEDTSTLGNIFTFSEVTEWAQHSC